ncbi:hypothetical protein FS749_015906 [Ceratobasidium sp. UAMH 11750]|nr:hypothetical protein FS749_015906 [Ceratobasidium sp. UAMH 11750]
MSPHDSSAPQLPVTSDAYQSWIAARDTLSRSVEHYVNACSALGSSFLHSESLPVAHRGILHQIASELDANLSTLTNEKYALQDAHSDLLRSRNSAKHLSPINALPRGLLDTILLMASPTCALVDDFTNLAGVCHLWRQLMLNAPSFWSHLDLLIEIPHISAAQLKRFRLWSQRSRGASLTLDIVIHVHTAHRDTYLDFDYGERQIPTVPIISELAALLTPIADRIEHVEIELFETPYAGFVQALLGCVILTCETKRINTLSLIFRPGHTFDSGPLQVFPWDENATDASGYCSQWEIETFLHSTGALNLDHVHVHVPEFDMDPARLHELSLTDTHATLSNFVGILKSCPSLKSLPLIGVTIIGATGESVHLPYLQNLELLPGGQGDSGLLLSLLVPGDVPLDMHMEIDAYEYEAFDSILSFFRRSNVSTLHAVRSDSKGKWFAPLCSNLLHLKQLVLEGCNFDDPDLLAYLDTKVVDSSHVAGREAATLNRPHAVPWSELQSINLVNCDLDMIALRRLIGLHTSIRKFRFIDHRGLDLSRGYPSPMFHQLDRFEREMSEIVLDSKCSGSWMYYCKEYYMRFGRYGGRIM